MIRRRIRRWNRRARARVAGSMVLRSHAASPSIPMLALLALVMPAGLAGAETIPVPTPAPREERAAPPSEATRQQGAPVSKADEPKTGGETKKPAPLRLPAAVPGCEAELRSLGVDFTKEDAIRGKGGCGVSTPFTVSAISPGIELTPPAVIRCEAALALARWVKSEVLPAAKSFAALDEDSEPGRPARLLRIRQASSYICRPRNGRSGARLSQHAIGAAIDIAGFDFVQGPELSIRPRGEENGPEAAFQRAVRGGACLHFTTVLGPGSDADHGDHLHLDIARRSGGYRICQ